MFWYVIIGFFAATGLLFLVWLLVGALLSMSNRTVVAVSCPQGREKALLRRYRWMRELGLTHCSLVLLDSELSSQEQNDLTQHFPGVSFATAEQWLLNNTKGA